jgi:trehalose synthase
MHEVRVGELPVDRLGEVLPAERLERFRETAAKASVMLQGRVVWNVNSTATGGGVAEMLQSLLAYVRGAGVDARWMVVGADPEFFATTKRLHNMLHGQPGAPISLDERAHYERVLAGNLAELQELVGPNDLVVLHDPQPAGLLPGLRARDLPVIWRCHIGRDTPNEYTELGWQFLRDYIEDADALIFSRAQYAPPWVPWRRVWVIPPSIDPFSPKNQGLWPDEVQRILVRAGLVRGMAAGETVHFTRRDGSAAEVRQHVGVLQGGSIPPPPDALLVTQISRWDRLKDMAGVMAGFSRLPADDSVHLVLAGPSVAEVADDPEGVEVLTECLTDWNHLPERIRARVHLACIPMDDPDENAVIVNALQRHAAVVIQKSLVEGFGLTVAEAMWKARPVVASAVGGIQDQITDGESGLLVYKPTDLAEFANALSRVLGDPALAERLGNAAHERARDHFLGDRHLRQYADLLTTLVEDGL